MLDLQKNWKKQNFEIIEKHIEHPDMVFIFEWNLVAILAKYINEIDVKSFLLIWVDL